MTNEDICKKIDNYNFDKDEINPLNAKCAPGISFEDGSCIELEILIDIANAYNNKYPNKILICSKYKDISTLEKRDKSKLKRYLLSELKIRMSEVCNNQKCWTTQDFINEIKDKNKVEYIKEFIFRPNGPSGNKWLSTSNMTNIFKQYEVDIPDFEYIGTVPIDYNEFEEARIDNEKLQKLYSKGVRKIGMIINLDMHWQNGSHWTALYADLDGGKVYFFDSYGHKPHENIRKTMKVIATFIQSKNKYVILDYNKNRHQYGNSECGVYSSYFIESMLKGSKFDELCHMNKIPDSYVNKLRSKYFFNVN